MKSYSIKLPRYSEYNYTANNKLDAVRHFSRYCARFGYTPSEIENAVTEKTLAKALMANLASLYGSK